MIGQDSAKPGTWYEEGFVVLQLLRLLNEEIESVQWEGVHEDGKGIDCWLRESGRRVAVQCKTYGLGKWTLDALGRVRGRGRSLLAYARDQLERDENHCYRLVSDAPSPDLKRLIDQATVSDSPDQWWRSVDEEKRDQLMRNWGLRSDLEETRTLAHQLMRRMEVSTTDAGLIDEFASSLGRSLAGAEAGRLRHELTLLARRSLTVELRAQDVHGAVKRACIRVAPRALDPWVHDRLEMLAEDYVESIAENRRMDLVERGETEIVLASIRDSRPGATVLVHGPAGCGKSEVIAAVVERLRAERTPLLVLRPDVDDDEIGLGPDPIAALVRYSAGASAVVVVDQLDQVLMGGDQVQQRLRRCRGWLLRAREAGITIVVGCRSVDAEKETQLSNLLAGSSGEAPTPIPVADFDEATVTSVLAGRGVAVNDLEASVRSLARRPICLRLMLGVIDAGASLTNLRSAVQVVDRWWTELSSSLPACDEARARRALDAVVDRMESDGLLSVPSDGIGESTAIDALCRAGVLVRENRGRIERLRPSHQMIADVRIAQRWRDVKNIDGLMQRLGERSQQSVHHARRLRLAVPLFVDRPVGTELLGAVVRSTSVRPILKRGVLLGVAAIDEPPDDVVERVRSWLDDEELRDHVLDTVVRGHVALTHALSDRGWIDRAWSGAASDDRLRDRLLGLLGSVATRWGDGVAEHLARWSENEPSVLERADRVFLHQPGEDTDALFAMRKEHIARNISRGPLVDWKALLRVQPLRALEILAILLERTEANELNRRDSRWAMGFPGPAELPPEASAAGGEAWALLAPWWRGIDDGVLRTSWFTFSETVLESIVELLSQCLTQHLTQAPTAWARLQSELARPLRKLDGWLLLRVGANLPPGSTDAADILASWFVSDPRWAQIDIGSHGSGWELRLAREFVARVGDDVSESTYRELERWILDYRDRWTSDDERRRPEATPSAAGVTAYQLLIQLPEHRLSINARTRLGELRRKFDERLAKWIEGVKGGYVGSVIPDDTADRWSVEEWKCRLTDPKLPEHGGGPATWHELGPDGFGEYTLRQLITQLHRLAEIDPTRYAEHARAFDGSIPGDAREAVLSGIARTEAPDRYARSTPWERLDDAEIAEVLARAEYLPEPACARRLGWIVSARPRFQWPDTVVTRLKSIAHGTTSAGTIMTDEFGLLAYRMNETACSAMHALGELAKHDPARRAEVLSVAAALVEHEDVGRRAAAAAAAVGCYAHDPETVAALVVKAAKDPRVAAERDIMGSLIWLTVKSGDRRICDAARQRLLALAGSASELIAKRGGHAIVALRMHGRLGDREVAERLACGKHVRRGAAEEAGVLLKDGDTPAWLLELALRLADDPDDGVADAVVHGLAYGPVEGFARDPEFLRRLLGTRSGKRNLGAIIDACDRRDCLLPIADRVVDMARAAASTSNGDVEFWRRYHGTRRAVDVLARLVEEAERESEFAVRTTALDAWDALLDSCELSAAAAFDKRVMNDIEGSTTR
jgi:hypothetical protein